MTLIGARDRVITTEAQIKEIATIGDTLKTMGIDEVLSIYQAAGDRWAATK